MPLSAGYRNRMGECTRARHGITVSNSGQPDQSRISARFEDILCKLKRRRVIERAYPHTVKALPADINFGDGHGIFPPFAISSLPGDSLGGLQRFERAQLQVSVSLSSRFASRLTSRRRYCLDADRGSTGFSETQSEGSTIRKINQATVVEGAPVVDPEYHCPLIAEVNHPYIACLLYTSPSPRD